MQVGTGNTHTVCRAKSYDNILMRVGSPSVCIVGVKRTGVDEQLLLLTDSRMFAVTLRGYFYKRKQRSTDCVCGEW